MKIMFLSDTHGRHREITELYGELPYVDIMVHSGDCTRYGEYDETDLFLSETHLNYPYKRYSFFEFVKLYPHSTWPWIIYSEKGEIKKQWIYETFDVKNFKEQLN